MGRRSLIRTLNLWMNGSYVGRWSVYPGGEHRLYYAQSWLESPESRPVSLSLPLLPSDHCHKGGVVENYFNNLLPDSDIIRQRIQRRFGTRNQQAFELLNAIGRDCTGALQILPDGYEPETVRKISCEKLDEQEIADILHRTTALDIFRTENPEDFRISLAGAQEKNALTFYENSWARPAAATPSTHIFKLPIGDIGFTDMSLSVENEWLCSRILNEYGLRTAECRIAEFGDIKTLVVERFDRRLSADGSWIMRLPQEDFCQAAGVPAGLKYESDGGPGIKGIMDTLLYSENSSGDRKVFFKAQILFWLLAAPDGHAKNFSIFLRSRGRFRLTPLYDVISAYPVLGDGRNQIHPSKLKMAMAVAGSNRHYHWQRIEREHWIRTANAAGINTETVTRLMDEIIESTPAVIESIESIIPKGFPEQVAVSIMSGLESAVGKLKG